MSGLISEALVAVPGCQSQGDAAQPRLSVIHTVFLGIMASTTATSNISSYLHHRVQQVKTDVKQKRTLSGWKLPKQSSTFAEEGTWSNIDSDVTPLERRTWSTWTILGFWFSDALNAQGWEGAASIVAVGLTWLVTMILRFKNSLS